MTEPKPRHHVVRLTDSPHDFTCPTGFSQSGDLADWKFCQFCGKPLVNLVSVLQGDTRAR